jgi:uncharacterized protein YndB with AHSA1/START domain
MTNDTRGAGRILGTLGSADGAGVVRLEDRFDTDIDDLWSALTQRERLARWIGVFEGDLRLGGEFRARYFTSGWEGTGRVDECEPPRRLLVRSRGTDATEEHSMEATLTADGDQTILVIESRGMPLEHVAGYGAGEQIHIEDLAIYLSGAERPDMEARFHELYPVYREIAATAGYTSPSQ